MTLYELTSNYLQLLMMAEDGDIDEQTFTDTLDGIDGEIEIKADGYAKVLKQLENDSNMIKAETDRLNARRRTIENNITRIKSNLEASMRATGKTKFKTDLFTFNIAKNPPALRVDDVDVMNLPAEYITFPKPEINKNAVRDALKAGAVLDWARMESGESLRIK